MECHLFLTVLHFSGFLEGIRGTENDTVRIKEFSLLELKKSAMYGAAYLGAKEAGVNIQVDSSANATIFYHHKF